MGARVIKAISLLLALASAYTTTPEAFGAVGDGKTDDWAAIQQAVASCSTQQSGCTVVFAKEYISGPIRLNSSGVTLQILGALLMQSQMKYPVHTGLPFISTDTSLRDIHITGPGIIGNKAPLDALSWWTCARLELGCFRPHLIVINNAHNVRIDGGLQLHNAPNHNIEVDTCTGVRVDGISIQSPFESPNTDGINFYGGHDQSFTNSIVRNGDDCVSVVPIGLGTDACVNGDPAQEGCRGGNVVVRNITCAGGHGISIGGVRHGTVSNVTFENMTATGGFGNTQGKYSTGGLRVKSYPNSTGSVYDIKYSNIVVDDVYMPLQLLGRYCPFPCKTPDGNQAVKFHDITFEDIRGTGRHYLQGDFDCSPLAPCENIVLDRVQLGLEQKGKAVFNCAHASLVFANASSPSACS